LDIVNLRANEGGDFIDFGGAILREEIGELGVCVFAMIIMLEEGERRISISS